SGYVIVIDHEAVGVDVSVMDMFHFPLVGSHRALAAACGLETVVDDDISAPVRRWVRADARASSRGTFALLGALALRRGGPPLLRRFTAGIRFYGRAIREMADGRGLPLGGFPS